MSIDWPISRRRVYGTEIPIWYCKKCGEALLPEPGKYYRPWIEQPPFEHCDKCGGNEGFIGESRTFDTWFDSSISPLFISGYLRDDTLFKKVFPVTVRPQAKDIIRTWLYYTLLRCYQLTGKNAFRHAWIMGYGVDDKGHRMSKSKGNVIDPLPLLQRYGADTFRFWNAAEANLGSDFRCSEEKIAGTGKFMTKIWNLARYVSFYPEPKSARFTASDQWILAQLDKVVHTCHKGYEDFNFCVVANEIRDFVWNIFAPHYVEMAKTRAYNIDKAFSETDQKAAWFTLNKCLKTVILLLAPICPFITDHVWRQLYSESSIHLEKLPRETTRTLKGLDKTTTVLLEFNSAIWKFKKDRKMPLNSPLSKVYAPKEIQRMKDDLQYMHKIGELMFGAPPESASTRVERIGEIYVIQ